MNHRETIRQQIENGQLWNWVKRIATPIAACDLVVVCLEYYLQKEVNQGKKPNPSEMTANIQSACSISRCVIKTLEWDDRRKTSLDFVDCVEKGINSCIPNNVQKNNIMPLTRLPVVLPLLDIGERLSISTALIRQTQAQGLIQLARSTSEDSLKSLDMFLTDVNPLLNISRH